MRLAGCGELAAGCQLRHTGGIIKIDVHGKNTEEAKRTIDMQIHAAEKRIRSMLREEYGYGREPAVKRIEMGDNQGITELVLREF